MRPAPIVRFERLYLAAIALGILATGLSWNLRMERAYADPRVRALGSLGTVVGIVTVALGVVVSLLLWFFIARRGSVVAKWIATILFALAALRTVGGLVGGAFGGTASIVAIIATLLEGAAIVQLFTPTAQPWFDTAPAEEPTVEGDQ